MAESMIEYALAYLKPDGHRPAFPVFPCTFYKIPLVKSWQEAPITTPDEVKKAWAEKPAAAIGILTGRKTGLIVIDVDEGHAEGVSGKDSLEDLESELGKLPEGPQVLTPSGGVHLWFKYPDLPKGVWITGAIGIRPGIDIRADGNFVIAPPSRAFVKHTHKVKAYEWEASSDAADIPLPDLPPAWIRWITRHAAEMAETKQAQEPPKNNGKAKDPPPPAEVGTRNDTIFKYGCSLRATGGDMESIRQALEAYNQSLREPLPQRELAATLKSIERYPQGQPQQKGRPPKEDLTLAAVEQTLTAMGYSIRLNAVTREMDVTGTTAAGRIPNVEDLVQLLREALIPVYKGVMPALLRDQLAFIARESEYNPILEKLDSVQWDGNNRLPEIYSLYGLEEDNLSQALIRKWLLQAIALLFNRDEDPFQPEGCLTLCGKQGYFKTSFFKKLALRATWFNSGNISAYDKDTTRRIVQSWITELGEADYTTSQTNPSFLNSFITNAFDTYRLPYAREDTRHARRASLGATCNEPGYISDQNGSRRWWTIPINRKPTFEAFNHLDALQLWAQIYAEVKPLSYAEKGSCFRLSDEERQALEKRNSGHKAEVKAQSEVEDIFAIAEERGFPKMLMTVSEFKTRWAETLAHFSVQQISTALKAAGIEIQKTTKGKRHAELPYPEN